MSLSVAVSQPIYVDITSPTVSIGELPGMHNRSLYFKATRYETYHEATKHGISQKARHISQHVLVL